MKNRIFFSLIFLAVCSSLSVQADDKYELNNGELWLVHTQVTKSGGKLRYFSIPVGDNYKDMRQVACLVSPNEKYAACSKFIEDTEDLDDFGVAMGTVPVCSILVVNLKTARDIRELTGSDVNQQFVTIQRWSKDNLLEFDGSAARAALDYAYDPSSNKLYQRGNFEDGRHLVEISQQSGK